MNDLPLVDSHLDLAENVTLFGRDLTLSALEIIADEIIRAVAERSGVIGLVLYSGFL